MRPVFLLSVFLCMGLYNISAQTVTLNDVCTFPVQVGESSGVIAIDSNRVITHNDSGDSARIFLYNYATCMLEKQVFIRNHTATDIEAITQDDSGYVYVADMGNNLGNRTNLCILKMRLQDIKTMDTVDAEKIQFSYADQVSFGSGNHNFDAESFFHHHDSLFVFSKNHGVAGTYTKRYAIPDLPGTYMPAPLDSFALPSWVTDAAIDRSHEHFLLVSEQKLYVFRINAGAAGFSDPVAILSFGFLSQKEGISFLGNDSVLVTDEYTFGTGGKLYLADLTQWVGVREQAGKISMVFPVIYRNNLLEVSNTGEIPVMCEVFAMDGKLLTSTLIRAYEQFSYSPGCHGLVHLYTGQAEQVFKF